MGLKLTKVYKVMKFQQRPWLKSYIEKNTRLRRLADLAGNPFDVDRHKLMVEKNRDGTVTTM